MITIQRRQAGLIAKAYRVEGLGGLSALSGLRVRTSKLDVKMGGGGAWFLVQTSTRDGSRLITYGPEVVSVQPQAGWEVS